MFLPDFEMKAVFDESLIYKWILGNLPQRSTLINVQVNIGYKVKMSDGENILILDELRSYKVYQNEFELCRLSIRKPMTNYNDMLFDWENEV